MKATIEAGNEVMIKTTAGRIRHSISAGSRARTLAASAILLAVAGCASSQSPDNATVEIKGSDPAAPPAVSNVPPASTLPVDSTPDANGIVAYDGYEAAVAREGDTVATIAQRIGMSASELGSYNGLSPTLALRAGDELVLPPRPGGYATAAAPAAPATTSIEETPLQAGTPAGAGNTPAASGSTAWSPDIAAAAIDRAAGFDEQGNLAAPPSAEEPLPPSPQAPGELTSPELRQYQTPGTDSAADTATAPVPTPVQVPEPAPAVPAPTPAPAPPPVEAVTPAQPQVVESVEPAEPAPELAVASPEPATPPEPNAASDSALKLIRPVTGPVIIGFMQGAGGTRNEGIDFASPSGSPVIAAASGEVALVSQSLGGLGTIVLVRHLGGEYLTVYGRIEKVSVKKGDIVEQGQKIGVVSPSTQPRMHFQVRRGAESLDPESFF